MLLVTTFSQVLMLLCVWLNKNVASLAQSGKIAGNCLQAATKKQKLHETSLFTRTQSGSTVTLTSYQCKKQNLVLLMTTLHPYVEISSYKNPKKKSKTVLFYNKTKSGIDVIDQMARKYSVKAGSGGWPVHVFYNVIDLALICS